MTFLPPIPRALGGTGLRRAFSAIAVAAIMAVQLPAAAFARGPESLADVAQEVIDAVVNISASTTVETRGPTFPQLPPGTPFEDLFEEFFNRRGQGDAPRQQRRSNSLGSGFVIDPQGIIVTNNHVIGEANDITVVFTDGSKLKAEIVGRDSKLDLAVLRVKPDKPLKAVRFGDSEALRIGDWVLAIGNPFGLGGSVSAGIVSANKRDIDSSAFGNYIQTDAAINKGNSGGPLFNMNGEVIGINTAILSPTGGSVGIGFAVPSSLAEPTIRQLIEFGETRRGWLGVRIQNVDDATAEALGLDKARGALVAGVDEKGPSKSAGIEVGDVIVSFDGKPVAQSRDLPLMVAQTPVGKEVDVVVIRKGKEETRRVKLGRLEEATDESSPSQGGQSEKPAVSQVLGLELSSLNGMLRQRYNIKEDVKGVVVTRVDPNSAAADKRIQPGDVIVEVNQEPVASPRDVTKRIEAVKKEGKKSVLLLVSSAQGEVRFVALSLQ
ncbi:DegQ family serine endoprotease [Chelatococcus composti]|jgi:serine protease Do|uniref:Probable periplasmic serine endoprotease DegP-like n=1 Tax=Chelatococcus composti TaxID=1743235 RepID=A0A841KAW8_9HYPH|nr:DegQ family serine endoprotease [Chelatococcus composti]MBB6166399.1 serine protease Do [Chelatococcus composti]MBS7734670.1 DegQ family serine endoprotease [Chelatococcus composti]GGG28632.1 serine protease [Chelatococcus composti]